MYRMIITFLALVALSGTAKAQDPVEFDPTNAQIQPGGQITITNNTSGIMIVTAELDGEPIGDPMTIPAGEDGIVTIPIDTPIGSFIEFDPSTEKDPLEGH